MPFYASDLSVAGLIHVIEANTSDFLLALARAAGSDERNDPDIQWIIGQSPIGYHNAVVRANLPPDQADAAILASIERFRAYQVPGTWHVGPSMTPTDLGARLIAHGFVDAGAEPGMAADLHALHEDIAVPDDLLIRRVTSAEELALWTHTLAQGFGEGEREAAWVGAMYERIGLDDQQPWRHYLGLLDGTPVATTSLFLSAGVAGIYFVFTVPSARRRGIGALITLAALRDARALGYRIGVLGASSMGYSVYQRLGFRHYCTISIYEWRSDAIGSR
jgi:GNAT superfamily N-acetyltransferase